MFDCIIVGAGPAGATAAYYLAKRGHAVLVLDKASFPRYKPCGGGVSPAIAKWFDFDFSPVIDNTITKVHYTWQLGDPAEAELQGIKPMWIVQREQFDQFLIEQAQQQGAQLKDNTEVSAIAPQGESWQVNTSNGSFEAAYLIGADGAKGPMAAWLGFKPRQEFRGATLEVNTSVPGDKLHTADFEFGSLKNGYIWNFPKSNGYSINAGSFRGKGTQDLQQPLKQYATKIGIDLSNSRYSEYPLSLWTENQPLHTHRAILAGEAAGIDDPLIGEGIRPAIFTGLKAAAAIAEGIASGNNLALANYTETISREWGANMLLAQRLAGLFYQFPKIAYKVGVKRPTAAQIMAKILCGELSYSDVTESAIAQLKKRLIPSLGRS